jgi:hypothetical protein
MSSDRLRVRAGELTVWNNRRVDLGGFLEFATFLHFTTGLL